MTSPGKQRQMEANMLTKLGISALILGASLALAQPQVASAADRDDYGYNYRYTAPRVDRERVIERERIVRRDDRYRDRDDWRRSDNYYHDYRGER
jgi:hypothetical protein